MDMEIPKLKLDRETIRSLKDAPSEWGYEMKPIETRKRTCSVTCGTSCHGTCTAVR